MKFLPLAPLLGLASACAAATPPPQEVRIVVVHEQAGAPGSAVTAPSAAATAPSTAERAPSRAAAPPPAEPSTRPATAEKQPLATAPAQRKSHGDSFSGCTVRRYATGWVEADCAEMRLLIQAGFAGKSHTGFSASVAMDRVGNVTTSSMNAFGKKTSIRIGKRRVAARAIEIRRPKTVTYAFGGEGTKRDASGKVEHRAVFAHVKTPKSGIVGVSCVASVDSYNRSRCVQMINMIARSGIPGGRVTGRSVTVAGVRLPLKPRCWAPAPKEVYCLLRGGLEWQQGTAAEMTKYREQLVATNFGLGVQPGHKTVVTKRTCKVGGKDSTCVRIDHWGLANYAVYTFHLAYVPDGDQTTVFSCRITNRNNGDGPAPACKKIFGL